ncbi:MAG: S8 family peptidase [Crocinitomicaceae bacterium]
MKTLIILSISTLLITANSFSQKTNSKAVWLKLENNDFLPTKVGKKLQSKDETLNTIITKNKVKSVEYVFSNSRNSELRNVVQFTCDCAVEDLYADLVNKSRAVKGVEIAPFYETLDTPNDFSTVFANDYALNLINAQSAWDVTTGSSDIIIGVSDQNFDVTHEELAGKVLFYDATNTATKTHGTAVAINAAGNTNNGVGKSSIGYNSSLKLYRMNYNDALAASYAGARVLNLSWTSGCTFNSYAQAAIDEIWNNRTFIVASAGNGTTCGGASNLVYPAAYNHVFAVTSVGPNDNHERTPGNASTTHQHNSSVDICAPGYDVAISAGPGWYLTNSGTSFAAPYVSGTVALMVAANSCLSNEQIESLLRETAVNIDALNPSYAGQLGSGRLNAGLAVERAYSLGHIEIQAAVDILGCTRNSARIDILNSESNPDINYAYQWSNGETTSSIINLEDGTYSVIVTAGCASDTATFEINTTLTESTAQLTNSSTPNTANGNINITVSGDGPFTYLWSNGSTSEDLSGVVSGNYSVVITNANGCAKTFQYALGYTAIKSRFSY